MECFPPCWQGAPCVGRVVSLSTSLSVYLMKLIRLKPPGVVAKQCDALTCSSHLALQCSSLYVSFLSLDDDVLTDLILLVNMANMAFKTFHIDGWNPFFVPFLKWTTESLMYYTI